MSENTGFIHWIIYTQPGLIPTKKGPFRDTDQVEKFLIEMEKFHPSETSYQVVDIWCNGEGFHVQSKEEFMHIMEIASLTEEDLNECEQESQVGQ